MERMEKQSAVRYAQELINIILYYLDDDELERINDVLEQAKEMDREQRLEEWKKGYVQGYNDASPTTKYPSGMPC